MKEYFKPTIAVIKCDAAEVLMAGSGVRNDGTKIIDGNLHYGNNEGGDGDDAAAKKYGFPSLWGDSLWED